MDPLSITATCVGLASSITRTSLVVISFVKDVRSARSDLDVISRELSSLKTILELLTEDVSDSTTQSIPQTLQKQITGIVTNCTEVVVDIEKTLVKHEGGKMHKAAKWVASGKSDVAKLQLSLEAHKSALEIALDMVALTLTREIKADTQEILNDTSAIKQDTAQILAEIARLQEQLPRDVNQRSSGFMLERYLDNLTSYAETVCDPFLDGSGGSRPTSRPGSSGEDGLVNKHSNVMLPKFHESLLRRSSVAMMTPLPAGKFLIENDEEVAHQSMQEHEDRSADAEELTGCDGPVHKTSSANLEPRPDIEEPADDGTITSIDDIIDTKGSVETERMENVGFGHLKIGVDEPRSPNSLEITKAARSPPLPTECEKVPEEPSFGGIIQVRIPGHTLWRRRRMVIDGQGYLTISNANAAIVIIPLSNNSPDTEKWKIFSNPISKGGVERFHISEFRMPSAQGFVKTLQRKIVLEHLGCGVLHIVCSTSDDYTSLLKVLKDALSSNVSLSIQQHANN